MEISEILVRILVAAALGGAIGLEREYRDKSAGFRTMILISTGAALFSIIAFLIFEQIPETDPARIISYIISGIGFLGAGVIVKDGASVKGLTTAATIWLSAALGMGAGAGFFAVSVMTCCIILTALIVLPPIEHWIDNRHETRTYEVKVKSKEDYETILKMFKEAGLKVFRYRRSMDDGEHWISVFCDGTPAQHGVAIDSMIESKFVESF